jgi:hypothetical protein
MLAAVYKYPGRTWSDADNAELLSVILMLNTRLGIVQSQTLQARNCCSCLMIVISKFQHPNAQSITPLWEMEMY